MAQIKAKRINPLTACSVAFILRARAAKDFAVSEERCCLGRARNRALLIGSSGGLALECVSLDPLDDGGGSTSKDGTGAVLDGDGNVGESDVVEDDGPSEGSALVGGGTNEDWGVGDHGVQDALASIGLVIESGTASHDIDTDLAVGDRDALPGPAPAPVTVDTGGSVGDGDVSDSELLVTLNGC